MCKWWDKMTGNHKSSAKVVDGSLILSLPDAITPVVWRMELGNAKASALEVRQTEDQEEERFILVLKKPQGDSSEIASYETKPKAVRALVEVSEALEKSTPAQSKQNTHSAQRKNTSEKEAANSNATSFEQTSSRQKTGSGKWVILLFGVLLVSGLGFYLSNLSTSGYDSYNAAGSAASSLNPASGTGTKTQTGIPLSADDFLRQQ